MLYETGNYHKSDALVISFFVYLIIPDHLKRLLH